MATGTIDRAASTFDALLELRDVTDGAEAATADEAGVAFVAGPSDVFGVEVNVTAIESDTGDETFVFSVDTDSEVAFGDAPVEVASLNYPRGAGIGKVIIPIHGLTVKHLDANAAAIRIGVTIGGTIATGITYGAHLIKL